MPLYDFRCPACGEEFEAFAPVGGTASCPACGHTAVERVLRPFAGPFTVAPRGVAARRSNAKRAAREELRLQRREVRRHQREQQ